MTYCPSKLPTINAHTCRQNHLNYKQYTNYSIICASNRWKTSRKAYCVQVWSTNQMISLHSALEANYFTHVSLFDK